MALELASVKRKAGHFFSGFTTGQKAMLVIAILAVVIGGFFFMSWATKPDMAVMFSNLDPSAAGEVTKKLDEMKITYELRDGGQTIAVPRADVFKTRVDLSAQGLPTGGKEGYSLLDNASFTQSDFQQKITFQRAVEGELASTISAMDDVQAATVHLVMPDDSAFVGKEDQQAQAAVQVQLKTGAQPTDQEIQSIVHLVSSSVKNLPADAVTVTDTAGNLLASPGGTSAFVGGTGLTQSQLSQQRGYEAQVSGEVRTLVEKLVGTGNVAVRVAAELNFDKTATTTNNVTTEQNPTPVESTTETESLQSQGGAATGTAGVQLPTQVGAGTSGPTTFQSQKQTAINPRTEERKVVDQAPGKVERMSVAVVVNGAIAGKEGVTMPNETDLQNVVSAAVGLDPTRGDTIQVQQMAFSTIDQQKAEEEQQQQASDQTMGQIMGLAKTALALLALAVVLFLVWRSLKPKKQKASRVPVEMPQALPSGPEAHAHVLEPELVAVGGHVGEALPAGPSPEEIRRQMEIDRRRTETKTEVTEFIENQPEDVAALLRTWLTEK